MIRQTFYDGAADDAETKQEIGQNGFQAGTSSRSWPGSVPHRGPSWAAQQMEPNYKSRLSSSSLPGIYLNQFKSYNKTNHICNQNFVFGYIHDI